MVLIRIGITESPPYWYVTNSSTLEGIVAPYIIGLYSAMMGRKANLSFISLDFVVTSCSDNGTCDGGLRDLQTDKLDFLINPVSYIGLRNIGTNLTVVPIAEEASCQLIYKKVQKLNLHYETFFSFINAFDLYFWLISFLLLTGLMIICILNLKRLAPKLKLLDIIWIQLEFILCQNVHKLLPISYRSVMGVSTLTLLVYTGILLSISLLTGSVSLIVYVRLDSLEDIIKYNYSVVIFATPECLYYGEFLDDKSRDEVDSRVVKPIGFINGSIIQRYRSLTRGKIVIIGSKDVYDLYKNIGCVHCCFIVMYRSKRRNSSICCSNFNEIFVHSFHRVARWPFPRFDNLHN